MKWKGFWVGGLVVLLAVCPRVMGDDGDDLAAARKRVAELELENARLRDRVQLLESQTGKGPTTAPADAAVGVGPTTRPAATQPGEEGAKTFATIFTLLECLPADARPDGKAGWESIHKDHAQLWFANNLKGMKFDGQLKVSMSKGPKVLVTVDGVKKYEYWVTAFLDAGSAEYANITIDPHFGSRVLKGDERLFEAAEQFGKAVEVRVTGTIKSVSLGPVTHGKCRVEVGLDDIKIHSTVLPE